MNFSVYLLCQSDAPVSRSEVASFIEDGSYFDTPTTYEPALVGDLGDLTIRYASGRSIRLTRLRDDDREGVIAEACESVDSAPITHNLAERLRDHLGRTKSVIDIEVDRASIDENAWAMLDALEADILRSRQGLLYVYGEGIYGPDLKLWPVIV
jgi:hypothetical protein